MLWDGEEKAVTGVVKVRDKEEGLRPVWGISLSVLNLQTPGSTPTTYMPKTSLGLAHG